MSPSEALECSASQPRVTLTMRLLKSQVDRVDSPPSAGLTTNQYESRLKDANVKKNQRDARSSGVPTCRGICGTSLNFDEFVKFPHERQGQCVLIRSIISEKPDEAETRLFTPEEQIVFR